MDTNVLIAALRSKRGASFQVFRKLLAGEWTAIVSNHLVYEYEEVMKRSGTQLGLSPADAGELLNAICARAEEWPLAHGWQPILSDADDEPLVQLAYESDARRVVTHNIGDLRPATGLGIELLRPREFLAELRGQA